MAGGDRRADIVEVLRIVHRDLDDFPEMRSVTSGASSAAVADDFFDLATDALERVGRS